MKRVFNSSETFTLHSEHGLRFLDVDIEAGQVAYFILTHYPKHKPILNIHRSAGKVCDNPTVRDRCPDAANREITQKFATLHEDNHVEVISTPGHYYIHADKAVWMDDICHPTVVEVFVGPRNG